MKKYIIAIFILIALAALSLSLSNSSDRSGLFKSPVKLLFVGDMMFDRTIRSVAEFRGYDSLFSCLDGYPNGFDVVIGNLEGPITASPSVSRGTGPGQPGNTTFTFDPLVASALVKTNINIVNLGNNHIFDFGREGIGSTKRALDAAGILYFGAPDGDIATSTVIGGHRIAFVSYNQFVGQSDPERVIRAIWKVRPESDFVVVYTHWGEEYQPETETQIALAHRFVDAGADLIIGSHPHVIQNHELYTGKHIYYSLGNFIFDQYWDERVRRGLGVEVTLGTKGKDASNAQIVETVFDISQENGTCRI